MQAQKEMEAEAGTNKLSDTNSQPIKYSVHKIVTTKHISPPLQKTKCGLCTSGGIRQRSWGRYSAEIRDTQHKCNFFMLVKNHAPHCSFCYGENNHWYVPFAGENAVTCGVSNVSDLQELTFIKDLHFRMFYEMFCKFKYDALEIGIITTDDFTNADILKVTYPDSSYAKRLCGDLNSDPAIPIVTGFLEKISPLSSASSNHFFAFDFIKFMIL
ncbi:integrase-type DNA-binding superfamily protein [Striga asiatica]|uniref:Integrase-type DNA-binding superfamily protein n=1 Tax=Striga asiatica TaxID=4170 RepID=A0A5A7P7W0_STRAF|nr:integrase-type DNA-binding superfamily protein [Striga asiatica]